MKRSTTNSILVLGHALENRVMDMSSNVDAVGSQMSSAGAYDSGTDI